MENDIAQVMQEAKQAMDKAIEHLAYELTKVRTGKVSPSVLEDIKVDYYGVPTPINQVATVTVTDARTLSIQPWEKKMLSAIEKAIFEANIGVTPMNDGEYVRLNFPPLTEERRKELAKQAKHYGEEAKISLRNARHKALDAIRKAVKDGYPEDFGKKREEEIQEMITEYTKKVDHMVEVKEKDIMKV
ncbi:MAG: ribosome-recycling factor [Saprospiraceae bacterium]|nr:MAG: ribosome-recycling factor [Saprospiraceae bacterium]